MSFVKELIVFRICVVDFNTQTIHLFRICFGVVDFKKLSRHIQYLLLFEFEYTVHIDYFIYDVKLLDFRRRCPELSDVV